MFIDDLKNLFSDSLDVVEKTYKKSDVIFREGKRVEGVFGIEKGQVKLDRYTNEGKTARIHHAKTGECFGEAALFSNHYDCYAIALEPSRLVLFPKKELLELLRDNPDTSIKYIALLSKHIKRLRTSLELRGILSARNRVVAYLVLAADPATNIVKLGFTVKDLSEQLGLTHETVYRALKNLEQDSIIKRSKNEIQLL